nr:DUF2092 domain-containing protein [uncultured Roseococcus sp.]
MDISRRGLGLLLSALAAAPASAAPDILRPEADALLRRLSDTLARAPSLAVDLGVLREVRMEDGRTVTLLSDVGIALRRPNRLRADIRGDAVVADIYYDGRQVTIHAPLDNAYAQAAAPPTIDGALTLLSDRLGVPLEAGNLLVADPHSRLAPGTTGEVEPSFTISGRPAEHLVLQSGEVSWELWVEQSEQALPLLAVIRRGGYRTLLRFNDWRLGPQIEDRLFTFVPPPNVRRLPLATRTETDGL